MPNLTPSEQQELETFIRDNFSQEDFAKLVAITALILKIDIDGLSLKEGAQKVAEAISNMDTNAFNKKLVDILTAKDKQGVTTEEEHQPIRAVVAKPQHFISPNSKASNRLFAWDNSGYYEGMRWLAVEGKKSKKPISVSLFVKYDDRIGAGMHLSMPVESQTLVYFDRIVHDAVVSQVISGNRYITTNMIYQVISGNSEGLSAENPVPKSLSKAISESITRLFLSWIEIDATEQAQAYGFDDGVYRGHLLEGSITEASLNGNITTCANVCEMPVLYRYANNCKQVIYYDVKCLDIPELENSVEGIVLKTYLLQQIQIMSHNKDFNRTICFDTLYALLGVAAPTNAALRKKKQQIRGHVIKCLDYWTKEEIISGYTLDTAGRAIVSVTLKVKLVSKLAVK